MNKYLNAHSPFWKQSYPSLQAELVRLCIAPLSLWRYLKKKTINN